MELVALIRPLYNFGHLRAHDKQVIKRKSLTLSRFKELVKESVWPDVDQEVAQIFQKCPKSSSYSRFN